MTRLTEDAAVRVGKLSFEHLRLDEPTDYCGKPDPRDKQYYCIKRSEHADRHRYGVILEWTYSGRTLRPRS